MRRIWILPAALLILSSCAAVKLPVPKGFAAIPDRSVFRAVSPEGMTFRVKTVDHDPPMDLEFWSEALENHMVKEGYRLKGSSDPPTQTYPVNVGDGVLFEWIVPYANSSYTYLTAVFVSKKRIVIAESAAENQVYRSHRDAILASLGELKMR